MIAKSLADAMSKERQCYRSQLWCTVRVESEKQKKNRRFDVSSFCENQLKEERTFISEKKTKSEELECVIFILSFNLLYIVLTGDMGNFFCFYQASQFLHRVYHNL